MNHEEAKMWTYLFDTSIYVANYTLDETQSTEMAMQNFPLTFVLYSRQRWLHAGYIMKLSK